jgi:hypothetical protein
MTFVAEYPRFMSPDLAESYVGGPTIFAAMKRMELIKPKVQCKRLTRYDRLSLDAACDAFTSKDLEESES